MEAKRNLLAAAVLVAAFILSTGVQAQSKKKTESGDFTDKLEKRFPKEAKRGENSIFRKLAGKKDDKKSEKEDDSEVEEEEVKDEEGSAENKSKPRGLAAIFGTRPAREKEEDADEMKKDQEEVKKEVADQKKSEDDADEEKGEEADKPKERKGLAALFGKRSSMKSDEEEKEDKNSEDVDDKKKEVAEAADKKEEKDEDVKEAKPVTVATSDSAEEMKEETGEEKPKERKMFGGLFSKKDESKKGEEMAPIADSGANLDALIAGAVKEENKKKPVDRAKQKPIKNADGTVKYASWEDLPYKEKSTVDKMMNKLQFRETKPRRQMRVPPPLPLPLPTSSTTASSSTSTTEEKAAEAKKEKKDTSAPVISDD